MFNTPASRAHEKNAFIAHRTHLHNASSLGLQSTPKDNTELNYIMYGHQLTPKSNTELILLLQVFYCRTPLKGNIEPIFII